MQAFASNSQNELDRLRRENAWLRAERKWTKDLVSNPNLDATDKICQITLRWDRQDKRKPLEEIAPVFYEHLAPHAGITAKTMGQHFKKMSGGDGIVRTTKKDPDTDKTHVHLAFTERALQRPGDVQLAPDVKKHGGKRFCTSCGSEHLQVRRIVTCMDCGHVLNDEKKEVMPDENFDEVIPEDFEAPDIEEELVVPEEPVKPKVIIEEEPEVFREPLPMIKRPWACHCGIRSRWIVVNEASHCTHCEPGYRS